MWEKEYKNYPTDTSLKKYKVEPSRGIVGCEMHDLEGWGYTLHVPPSKAKRKGLIRKLLDSISKFFYRSQSEDS